MNKKSTSYTNEELLSIYKNQGRDPETQNHYAGYDEEVYEAYVEGDTHHNDSCFITTAVCSTFGKPDDCAELTAFRKFRDTFMSKNDEMSEEVSKYYSIAPRICEVIEKRGKEYSKKTYAWIWETFLSQAYDALNNNELEKAHEIYKDMVLKLEKIYL